MRLCTAEGCGRKHHAKGFCKNHWQASKNPPDHRYKPTINMPLPERFWYRVNKDGPNGCWVWTGTRLQRGGYGVLLIKGKSTRAHRYAYQLLRGPIPDGLQIDHLCRNRLCVNPDHLEAVTLVTNVLRGNSVAAIKKRMTQCKLGHNAWVLRGAKQRRRCAICERVYLRKQDRIRRWGLIGDIEKVVPAHLKRHTPQAAQIEYVTGAISLSELAALVQGSAQ